MTYTPATDFIGVWRAVTGGVQKGEVPSLDLIVNALSRCGLFNITIATTAPVANQSTTMWYHPATPSYSAEGALFLWNGSAYVAATPSLFKTYLAAIS
jgi:hypothetical protein